MLSRTPEDELLLKRFGDRLRQLRLSKGLTQEETAARSGLSRSYYTQVETGRRNVALLNLYKLAQCLEIPLHELLDIESDNDKEF